jgi:membrane protein
MGFTTFVAASAHYQAIYSSFAVLILFLLWLYTSWFIVLIGAEITYLHQNPILRFNGIHRWQRSYLLREQLSLALLMAITQRYLTCEPPWSTAGLAEHLRAPVSSIEGLINEFVQAGILIRTLEPEGVALGCPPEQIAVSELIEMLRLPSPIKGMEARASPELAVLQRRDVAVREALKGVTLRTLAHEQEGSNK